MKHATTSLIARLIARDWATDSLPSDKMVYQINLKMQCRWMGADGNIKVPWNIWALSWEDASSGVSDQVRFKLPYSATAASRRLEILVTETIDITLSRQWTTKALIRLCGCAGWSAHLLFAYDVRHVFSWPGSFVLRYRGICHQRELVESFSHVS